MIETVKALKRIKANLQKEFNRKKDNKEVADEISKEIMFIDYAILDIKQLHEIKSFLRNLL